MTKTVFHSDLILLLSCCQEIGSLVECNSSFQVQLTESVLAFCEKNQIAIGQLTISQLLELLRFETEKFNGGAS